MKKEKLITVASKEHKEVLKMLDQYDLHSYVKSNLHSGLLSIGFSLEFVSYLLDNFEFLNFQEFYKLFGSELSYTYDLNFFHKIVPDYFNQEVVPHIPESNTILDLGCGTGILIHSISNKNKFNNLVGIDIDEYPEWKNFNNSNTTFKVVKEENFQEYLNITQPDNMVLTWTLHHMEYKEQVRYLKKIFASINKGSRVIILEDSYSEILPPKRGLSIYKSFIELSPAERQAVMSVFDWVANRILARRESIPIPYCYRTLEEWKNLCNEIGFKIYDEVFIGFPNLRDINTPHSLFILEK